MSSFSSGFASLAGGESTRLQTIFDAEHETPKLIDKLAQDLPSIHEVMSSLRGAVPLVSHSGIGPQGRFFRLPNHYRSISLILPPSDPADPDSSPGAIVFKGTEPLLPDFPEYLDWMLHSPFRMSPLPLGLHFPLDMKLPPAAMWIEECKAEQAVSSSLQKRYLNRHGRLARLPLPLFVFKLTSEQSARYEEVVRSRLPDDAIWKISNKLRDGLGVEVYYYPELPVRAADLMVGNVRETFKQALEPEQLERTFACWTSLMTEILCLDYMPYAPWHHGMGGCVDPGNVCIDGGFNDLLTLVPFDAIPNDVLFSRSLQASIQALADSMVMMAAAATGAPLVSEPDATVLATRFIFERVHENVRSAEAKGYAFDARLKKYFEVPGTADIVNILRNAHKAKMRPTQFLGKAVAPEQELAKISRLAVAANA